MSSALSSGTGQRIVDALLARIEAGEWPANARLPVERELAELFACTRITLRQALQQLEADRRIYRENRRGWFVSAAPIRYNANSIEGFMQYVAAQGHAPRTELLSAQRQPAGPQYAALLGLEDPETLVFVLQRRRSAGRRALMLETNVLLESWAPGLLEQNLEGSLSALLARHGRQQASSRLEMSPSSFTPAQAPLLYTTAGMPCFRLQRVGFDHAGRGVELDIECWRHDALVVTVDVQAP